MKPECLEKPKDTPQEVIQVISDALKKVEELGYHFRVNMHGGFRIEEIPPKLVHSAIAPEEEVVKEDPFWNICKVCKGTMWDPSVTLKCICLDNYKQPCPGCKERLYRFEVEKHLCPLTNT